MRRIREKMEESEVGESVVVGEEEALSEDGGEYKDCSNSIRCSSENFRIERELKRECH